jgi:hypothetical protein
VGLVSLSQRELDLIAKIGECMREYRQLLYDDGLDFFLNHETGGVAERSKHSDTARDGDINEFSQATHIMQRMVMSRSAQRMHPKEFGRRPAPVVDSPA